MIRLLWLSSGQLALAQCRKTFRVDGVQLAKPADLSAARQRIRSHGWSSSSFDWRAELLALHTFESPSVFSGPTPEAGSEYSHRCRIPNQQRRRVKKSLERQPAQTRSWICGSRQEYLIAPV